MQYINAFVAAVPDEKKQDYIKHNEFVAQVFKDAGALKVVECWGDDVPEGTLTSFPLAVKCKEDETVVIGWIEWASKEASNSGMQKAFEDERMHNETMPFDGKRIIFGGFEVLFER